jgi:hypothetical protein
VLSQSGTIGFVASLDSGSSSLAIYLAGMAGPKRLAGIGDALPDGGRLGSFPRYPAVAIGPDERPAIDNSGNVAFLASVRRGRDSSDAIFLRRGGELRKLIAAGDAAPGGGIFSGLGAVEAAENGPLIDDRRKSNDAMIVHRRCVAPRKRRSNRGD